MSETQQILDAKRLREQGVLPAGWRVGQLKNFANFTTGWTPPSGESRFYDGDLLWANISDLGTRTICETKNTISDLAVTEYALKSTPKGSLLFSFKLSVGDVSFAGVPMFTNEAIASFAPQENIDLGYAYWSFPLYVLGNASENIYGAKMLNQQRIRSAQIACPPLPEQKAIAAFLDREAGKIDALVEEQRRLIALLKEKRQAVISHAVTKGLDPSAQLKPSGIDWLGDIPAHWDAVPVGYRYEIQLGRMLNAERAEGDYPRPYLRVFDVQWHQINTEDLPMMDFPPDAQERYRLEPGDLMVNEGGSYVGRSAIWRGAIAECYYQKALHRLRPRDCQRDYADFFVYVMEYATTKGIFIAGGNQTTIDHLTAEQLKRYRFAFPPASEQLQIGRHLSERLSQMDDLTNQATRAIALLQERRAALISASVTGKIDVRDTIPNDEEAA